MIGEITDSTNQALAFPIYGLCWPLGGIIGYAPGFAFSQLDIDHICPKYSPLLGGTFANPAAKWPQWFDNDLFTKYPYLLPCLIASSIAFIDVLFGLFFMEEVGLIHRSTKRLLTVDCVLDTPSQAEKAS